MSRITHWPTQCDLYVPPVPPHRLIVCIRQNDSSLLLLHSLWPSFQRPLVLASPCKLIAELRTEGEEYTSPLSSPGVPTKQYSNLVRCCKICLFVGLMLLASLWLPGRTHRSNQISSPEYIFLISALSGEQRFASIVAKRLESLGALTHGDRRATDSRDMSKFNVDTKYGRQALENTLKSIVSLEEPAIKMDDYPKDFFEGGSSLYSLFLSQIQ